MLITVANVLLFLLSAVSGASLSRRRAFGWIALTCTVPAVWAFNQILAFLPFKGVETEFIAYAAALAAMTLVFTILFSFVEQKQSRAKPIAALLVMACSVGVFLPMSWRLSHATALAWACDGEVVEKYASSNHAMPTLVVENRSGDRLKMEGVTAELWERAAIHDRLSKRAGNPLGQLNGQTVRIVRPVSLPFCIRATADR